MNPLSPWVALTEISLMLAATFLLGFGIAWVRARSRLRRIRDNIREAKRDLATMNSNPGSKA